jgi:hypothetical protein
MSSLPGSRLTWMARNGFERRLVRMPPGCAWRYVESDWEDELVIVVCGEVELEGESGRRWHFSRGAIIWLTDLPLHALHNPCTETTILMAVSRPMSSRAPGRPDCHD